MWNMIVVEDESIVRIGLRYMLDWESFGVAWKAEASNGEEALRLIGSQEIHIVVTDIRMPVMDGIELVRRLRNQYPDVQIIVISSYNDFAYVQEALRLGVADYLHKPTMTPAEVQASLERLLSRMPRQQQSSAQAQPSPAGSHEQPLKQWMERLGSDDLIPGVPHVLSAAPAAASFQASRLAQGYCLILFRLETGDSLASGAGSSLFYSVSALIQGFAVLAEDSLLVSRHGFELLWLKPAGLEFDVEQHHLLLGDIRRTVMNLLHSPLQCSSSAVYGKLEEMKLAYEDAAAGFVEPGSGYSQTIRLAKEYVDLHFRRDLSLSECASCVHVSSGHLSRLFAKELGSNFSEYVNHKKLEHAKGLLAETNMKINKVAEEVGYLNPHYFSKLFKEYTGLSPREFRNA